MIEYRARVLIRRACEMKMVSQRHPMMLLLIFASRRNVNVQATRFAAGVDARAGFAAREGGEPR